MIGAINSRYNERVTEQNIETGKRRDYIANTFGDRGRHWRERCKQRASLEKFEFGRKILKVRIIVLNIQLLTVYFGDYYLKRHEYSRVFLFFYLAGLNAPF